MILVEISLPLLFINNKAVERLQQNKNLESGIDSLKPHIYVCKKAQTTSAVLMLTQLSYKRVYFCFIEPILNFSGVVQSADTCHFLPNRKFSGSLLIPTCKSYTVRVLQGNVSTVRFGGGLNPSADRHRRTKMETISKNYYLNKQTNHK